MNMYAHNLRNTFLDDFMGRRVWRVFNGKAGFVEWMN